MAQKIDNSKEKK